MENVKKFYKTLANSETLKEKAAKLNEKYNEAQKTDEEAAIADVIAFAASEGYSFTAEEFAAYGETVMKSAPQELSQDELEAVAGGSGTCSVCFSRTCACLVAGGGTHQEPHWPCACVAGGAGANCSGGNMLICVGFGCLIK